MSDEEKQAIFKLREIIDFDKQHRIETIYDKEQIEFRNNIELMLNLVEKQAKEIEYLEKNQRYKKDFNGDKIFCLEYDKETLRDMVLEKQEEIKELKSNSIPKDKLKERIMLESFDFFGKKCIKVKDIEKLIEKG